MRKARSDGWYAGLSVEQLDQVFDWCNGEGGYAAAAAKVAAGFNRRPSLQALSRWFSSWPLQRAFLTAGSLAERLKEMARDLPELRLDPAQVDAVGQALFQIEAVRQMDREAFGDVKRWAQRDRELGQVDRRITLLEQRAQQADKTEAVLGDTKLTDEERRRRIAEIYGRA
jgi:hypothetical protein